MIIDLPIKITPCPIVEAIIEIRFESLIPDDAIFGILYNELKVDYSNAPIKLPILQLPESIRSNDPNLRFNPYYKINKDSFVLQIGPRVVSLSVNKDYPGWNTLKTEIINLLTRINKLGIVSNVTRLGMRYINFFDLDIYEKSRFQILLDDKPVVSKQNIVRLEILKENINQTVQISNDTDIVFNNDQKHGSIIDIDNTLTSVNIQFFDNMDSILERMHSFEKKLFFSLLKAEFVSKELSPVYQK